METTNRLFSGFAAMRARLAMLAATLVAATVGLVSPASAAVTGLTMGGQTGSLFAGTAGSVTYDLTLTRNSSYPSNSSIVNWSVAPALPAGATASFAALGGWSGTTRAYRMTISTTAAALAGTSNFSVTATPSLANQGSGTANGSLVIQAAVQAAQTISFAPIADRAVGDPPFTVSATASSGLPVSLAATAGTCTVAGNTVTLNATVPGSCTITASQAGNASYLPATDVSRTFNITAPQAATGFDLFATSGSTTLNGDSVPVWGYRSTDGLVAQPGGPTLVVNQGETITVLLHNRLSETTAILFQGQDMVPDTVGAAPGTTKVYTFVANHPGTFLYEAGPLLNAEHQVAMGLYGALVVRPATAGQAYDAATTAFTKEAVLVLSEIDPLLNNTPVPSTFDMREFRPAYFLINGTVYPDTPPIASAAGDKVLLRYVNAGAKHHSMAILGARQNLIAEDGSALQFSHPVVAKTIAPGQTTDAIVTIPATTPNNSKLAVYDGSLMLHNYGNDKAFGGMMTFVNVTAAPGTGDTTGPLTSGASVNAFGTLLATVSDAGRGDANVTAAEYFLDATGGNGTGVAMTSTAAAGPTRAFTSATNALSGNHMVFVHGRDAQGNWGPFISLTISADTTGPTTSALTLLPNPTNGTVDVVLTGTADDTATGGSNIAAAEYQIDGGAAVAMDVSPPAAAKIAGLSKTIPAATVGALSNGNHTVSVRSQDAGGYWGSPVTTTLTVIKTAGPVTSGVNVTPSPNNGAIPLSANQPVVRVTATVDCSASCLNVGGAEGFIDTAGANGSGFPFVPTDGAWNGQTETVSADIPLSTIAALSDGTHTIVVHGKESVGVWGATSTATLVIDKTAPTITGASLSQTTIASGTASVTLNLTAGDGSGTGVARGQYWIDGSATPPANPTAFTGTSVAVNTSALTGGTHTVYVRVQDGATNWSAVSSVTVYVVQAVADAKSFNASGTNGTQTQNYNSNGTSLRANDFPNNGNTALASAPVRTGGTGTVTPTLSCPGGGGNTAATPSVGGSTICTNGRFTVNLPDPGGSNAAQAAGRRGTYTFTYTITSGSVTSPPATVTINVN